jgi:spermidine synthase
MQGLHLTADLYGCACERSLLIEADSLAVLCRKAVGEAMLTVVDEKFSTFPNYHGQPGGVTGALLLAESHLAIHTWPERVGVTLDVYVCNFSTDNSAKAERLMDDLIVAFKPSQQNTNRILRGSADPESKSDELLIEWLNPYSAFGYRADRRLETVKSKYQTIEVFNTPQFGTLFRLDGRYMTSERDEFFYHEPLVHAAALTHPGPRSALVIGGGDGGSTEELLKHPSIRRIVLAELDEEVIRIAKRYLRSVHRDVFDDPRVEVKIGDGFEYVRQSGEKFDLIVLDLTDPDTPAHRLYTSEFFRLARNSLAPGGAMSLHIGSPVFTPQRVAQLLGDLQSVFSHVRPLGLYVPLYGSYWGMAIASDSLDPLTLTEEQVAARLGERRLPGLQYYNAQIHRALFALPSFYRDLACAGGARP